MSSKRSQLQQSLLKKAEIKKPIVFNPKGFDLAKALGVGKYLQDSRSPSIPSISDPYIKAFADSKPLELVTGDSVDKQEQVIEAAYQQVFGNAHLMESERSPQIESQLRSGQITVMEFVRALAKGERYRALFFDSCPNLRAIELNFKHLLGRAPENHAEISQHIKLLVEKGFEAEIDSYLDSEEYLEAFGENIVPYYRGYQTQTGKRLLGYTYMFEMLESVSTSDRAGISGNKSRLQEQLMSNNPSNLLPISVSQPVTDPVKLIRLVLKIS